MTTRLKYVPIIGSIVTFRPRREATKRFNEALRKYDEAHKRFCNPTAKTRDWDEHSRLRAEEYAAHEEWMEASKIVIDASVDELIALLSGGVFLFVVGLMLRAFPVLVNR